MKKEYEFSKKDKFLLILTIGICIYLFFMCFATFLYVLQWNYLEPEPGSTFEEDIRKATLCYIFIPIAQSVMITLIISVPIALLKARSEINMHECELHTRTPLLDFDFTFKNENIIKVYKFSPLFLVGRREIVVKVNKFTENGVEMHANRRFVLVRVCTKKEYKEYLEILGIN